MHAGDLVQIQKHIRVHECGHVVNRLDDHELLPSLNILPGEVYLLTDFFYGEESYPIYNYFEITILAAGRKWETTITIDSEDEIDDFIRVFESSKLTQRR
jgi:hypothetical protein